jgi:hypothetical protein
MQLYTAERGRQVSKESDRHCLQQENEAIDLD